LKKREEIHKEVCGIFYGKSAKIRILEDRFGANSLIFSEPGYLYFISEGNVRLHSSTLRGQEFFKDYQQGNFIWLKDIILGVEPGSYGRAITETILLKIPLKDLAGSTFGEKLWELIAVELAKDYSDFFEDTVNRLKVNSEDYIVNYLIKGRGKISFNSTAELAERLNLNLRTLQRTLKKMIDKKIISKKKNEIELAEGSWIYDKTGLGGTTESLQ